MCNSTCKYENTKKCQRDNKGIKISIIPPTNTISHPWTMMIKSL